MKLKIKHKGKNRRRIHYLKVMTRRHDIMTLTTIIINTCNQFHQCLEFSRILPKTEISLRCWRWLVLCSTFLFTLCGWRGGEKTARTVHGCFKHEIMHQNKRVWAFYLLHKAVLVTQTICFCRQFLMVIFFFWILS